ncbi:methylated-DNA--[protein]-cysteine S-methyltransferase [Marinisporobacter balticus]|uniref:Methylated-DNA--protein-cysteine methyltransferase n=1 Tax=Marinisporobacter balticus TaxID=2018667 RepID=A0A4R2KHN9_9FIRM|nr:methylated-DNA--[protein]-cysteine S-methyltransferase [Marinisporobacter balticus]TCO72674.1 methylated-DNA-[protein]-cysteine S-methyltransferase [Marinisporobacter balticus]
MKRYHIYYQSPIGILEISSTKKSILSVDFVEQEEKSLDIPPILKKTSIQLDEYFKGKRKTFDLNLSIQGTAFQKQVWDYLTNIDYGNVVSYKDVAKAIRNEKAVRAVGNANNKNKIAIIIPCHRVIGSNGKLTGYAGGIWRKEWLLKHEQTFHSSPIKGNRQCFFFHT